MRTRIALLLGSIGIARCTALHADEGMWTFDNPPTERLQRDHGFLPTPEWLDHVRLASVRFNDGGSGSFISGAGLVLTNHHVGLRSIQKMSSKDHDYVKQGFYARTRADELRCPDLELNVLMGMADVTARVQGAANSGAADKEQNDQRKAEMARIEKEASETTGLRCNVVSLYQGAEYWLYRYQKFKDVRLVFAPEQQIAFFGGDPDNFTYPRFDLDFAIFRVYENEQPIQPPAFLKWSAAGAAEDELVFVSGNPGSTGRLQTMAQLEYMRDSSYPRSIAGFKRLRDALARYAASGAEAARRSKDLIFGYENSIKAQTGYLEGLQQARVMLRKADEEQKLRAFVPRNADVKAAGDPWEAIARARATLRTFADAQYVTSLRTRFTRMAEHIVRLAAEQEKQNEDRLPEYRDSNLDSLKFELFSSAPVYPDLEEVLLAEQLAMAEEKLGADDAFVKAALDGQRPADVARSLIAGTTLIDVATRKQLVDGGRQAVAASADTLIAYFRKIDPITRALRKRLEDEVESVETQAGDRIAKVRFALLGRSTYPDATFTLRLAYGTVKGYDVGGTRVPYKTTFHGLYERHAAFDGKPPFDLPRRYLDRKAQIDLDTPLDFALTTDIIGGNSGSPVINRQGELVGLIFDGNIESLGNRFVYDEQVARAVAVHSRAIIEALGKIYDAAPLAQEILFAPLASELASHVAGKYEEAHRLAAKARCLEIEDAVQRYRLLHGALPDSLAALSTADALNHDQPWIEADRLLDPWGNAFVLQLDGRKVTVLSYGADGKPGGTGSAADVTKRDSAGR
ncbi:MAG: S46 family peptidase [Planctomycetota bacterium]